jgi:RNA recognition motif-containing protein
MVTLCLLIHYGYFMLSRGFGFVSFSKEEEYKNAIACMDGTKINMGSSLRALIVKPVRPSKNRPDRSVEGAVDTSEHVFIIRSVRQSIYHPINQSK